MGVRKVNLFLWLSVKSVCFPCTRAKFLNLVFIQMKDDTGTVKCIHNPCTAKKKANESEFENVLGSTKRPCMKLRERKRSLAIKGKQIPNSTWWCDCLGKILNLKHLMISNGRKSRNCSVIIITVHWIINTKGHCTFKI